MKVCPHNERPIEINQWYNILWVISAQAWRFMPRCFPAFLLPCSNSRLWSIVIWYRGVPACRPVIYFHITAPETSIDSQCRCVWRYGRLYTPAVNFNYFCSAMIGCCFSMVFGWSVRYWLVVIISNFLSCNFRRVHVSNAPFLWVVFGTPFWSKSMVWNVV